MKTVLVTGAGGYIGSILTVKLAQNGYRVLAVDRFFFGRSIPSQTVNVKTIRDDSRRLRPELFAEVDAVIDLVAISNDPTAELFSGPTWAINRDSRIRTAGMAREAGVKRYVFPSSASIYGYQDELVDESSPTNPLTVYAKANEEAERAVLEMADDAFTVTVMRQATVYGYSPRMRFDLAINGMTFGAWKEGVLPLMRDGKQYRPMVHVQDTTDVMLRMLEADSQLINGEIFNVGGEDHNFQIEPLAQTVAACVKAGTGRDVAIKWYGDPDRRSYRLSFHKIREKLGWTPGWTVEQGIGEIIDSLKAGLIDRTERTITLEWYKQLVQWHATLRQKSESRTSTDQTTERWRKIVDEVELYGGILDIENE